MPFWQGLADLLYPPRCLLCRQPPRLSRDHFCEDCAASLFNDPHSVCPRCAATVGAYAVHDGRCGVCRHEALGFDSALRLGVYEKALERAVLRIKHASQEGLAELLGERWAELHRGRFLGLGVDAVVPVPLYWWRRIKRGYNQSAALAYGLASRLGLPCRRWWLRRCRNTSSQKELSRTQRRENLHEAFRPARGVRLTGKHILLVDDVMTTGATLSEAARALKQVGAQRITAAVLARAEGGRLT
jgi:ComF family protein